MKEEASQTQPLHLAESFSKLQEVAEVKLPKLNNHKQFLDRLKMLSRTASEAKKRKDQESEFMFLHRYMLLVAEASKHPDYKNNKNVYGKYKEITREYFQRYDYLCEVLPTRYETLRKKSSECNNSEINKVTVKEPKPASAQNGLKPEATTVEKSSTRISITCEDLHSLLRQKDKIMTLLLIDMRSYSDFKESHIRTEDITNLPGEIVEKGVTASVLGKRMNEESRKLWDKRGACDLIIIFDWNCTEATINDSKICFLKDAMLKWDPITKYKNPPVILEGGYEELLNRYPHITTNPKVQFTFQKNMFSMNSLDSLSFPIEDLEPKEVSFPPSSPQDGSTPTKASTTIHIDRSTKPKILTREKPVPSGQGFEDEVAKEKESPTKELEIDVTEDSSSEEDVSSKISEEENIKTLPTAEPINLKPSEKSLEELRKVKPIPNTSVTPPPQPKVAKTAKFSGESSGVSRIPLRREGTPHSILKRTSSSPNMAQLKDDDLPMEPSFTRANKPKTITIFGEGTDATYGETASGLTGLKNFANNCYMNSIIQCLSNTRALVNELTNLSKPVINKSSKTRGRVAQEVIRTLGEMWSGQIKVSSLKELKSLMGNIKDIFKGTSHQDSNEFLIILLEYLHEDLNVTGTEVINLDGAVEETGEKAWGEFKKKNSSIIRKLFYGQQKSTIICSKCRHSSVTFEPFFNLFVPIPSNQDRVTLNDCIKLYMEGENICGWKCPKCQTERNAMKKFDISILPPILIIALKRFTQEDDSWLHKKENIVTYPLDGLDMKGFTVEGSEQRNVRYSLYAVSTHSGTLRSGHYKAICKNSNNRKWYMFDDQSIDPLSSESVQNNPEAYILFYESVN